MALSSALLGCTGFHPVGGLTLLQLRRPSTTYLCFICVAKSALRHNARRSHVFAQPNVYIANIFRSHEPVIRPSKITAFSTYLAFNNPQP